MTNRIRLVQPQLPLRKVLDRLRSPLPTQERVLRNLLFQASETQFGKHYAFANILEASNPIEAFQRTVPVHHYDKLFEEWWHRTLAGEADVTWPGTVPFFALSSGTSGAASKYIPVTPAMTRAMRSAALRMFACLPKYPLTPGYYTKDWLMVGSSSTLTPLETGAFAGDLSGINSGRPPMGATLF
ncbi:MAG: GH3 auxin-responsive promoter family protein [Saprospiraceae bacterium]